MAIMRPQNVPHDLGLAVRHVLYILLLLIANHSVRIYVAHSYELCTKSASYGLCTPIQLADKMITLFISLALASQFEIRHPVTNAITIDCHKPLDCGFSVIYGMECVYQHFEMVLDHILSPILEDSATVLALPFARSNITLASHWVDTSVFGAIHVHLPVEAIRLWGQLIKALIIVGLAPVDTLASEDFIIQEIVRPINGIARALATALKHIYTVCKTVKAVLYPMCWLLVEIFIVAPFTMANLVFEIVGLLVHLVLLSFTVFVSVWMVARTAAILLGSQPKEVQSAPFRSNPKALRAEEKNQEEMAQAWRRMAMYDELQKHK